MERGGFVRDEGVANVHVIPTNHTKIIIKLFKLLKLSKLGKPVCTHCQALSRIRLAGAKGKLIACGKTASSLASTCPF